MAEAIPEWRKRWDEECPLMIGVAYSGWESGSDAALRDELKRIRDVGFTAVRVRFDREGDIEKMAGMMNWRNPDRFFDAAEKAGLKVLAAPGNRPHSNADINKNELRLSDAAIANVAAWLQKFCGQYREHPALLAWILQEDNELLDSIIPNQEAQARQDNLVRLLAEFHAADTNHPVITTTGHTLNNLRRDPTVQRAAISDIVGTSFHLQDYLLQYKPDTFESELDRPAYITARFTAALMPNPALPIIAACTGGSIRYQGDYAAAINEGKITRMLLLFLAAGMKLICFDRWKPERRGPNAGEGALLDWLDRATPQALAAGCIARAAHNYSKELWKTIDTPHIHVLYSETNDLRAQITAWDQSNTTTIADYENEPARARFGAARTLLNANTPFAFITEQQLINDVVPPAPILFLPHVETLSESLLLRLKEYATNGGRVVADMPTGYLNENGELLDTRPGSPFEQLFGVSVAGLFCFSNPAVREAEPAHGQQRANLVVTTARAGGGQGETPAFTENRVGKGRAVLVNLSLSRLNAAQNLQNAQLSLLSYILGSKQTALPGLTNCLIFRRTSEHAEHVFLVNDSAEERTTEVAVTPPFTQAQDAITEENLTIENNAVRVTVPAGSGRWLRLAK